MLISSEEYDLYLPLDLLNEMIQNEIPDETNNSFDKWPSAWRMQELDKNRQTIVHAHRVLGTVSFRMTGGQVTQSTNLGNITKIYTW